MNLIKQTPARGLTGFILFGLLALFSCLDLSGGKQTGVDSRYFLSVLLLTSQDPGEEYSGGWTTTWDHSLTAFNRLASNVRDLDRAIKFSRGNSLFKTRWRAAPAGGDTPDGLGPVFNQTSCNGCHFLGARGRTKSTGESAFETMIFRISSSGQDPQSGGPAKLAGYGTQLDDKSVGGSIPLEATPDVSWTEIGGSFPDGEVYSLRRPTYTFSGWNFGIPGVFQYSPRVAPVIPGLGLLEAVAEEQIYFRVDPYDRDNDGISGRANYVYDWRDGQKKLGRFGLKANQPHLPQQNQAALSGDMGLTSPLFPDENCEAVQVDCAAAPSGATPYELSNSEVDDLNFYMYLVGVPGRRNWKDNEVIQGKILFHRIACSSCHVPEVRTGFVPNYPELSYQLIRPYTDLLLHDMGPELADARPDFLASGSEWRTPPLWTLGLLIKNGPHDNLLHDGRARGFKEAILWHGGEAQESREKFKNLSRDEREAIIKFLKSL